MKNRFLQTRLIISPERFVLVHTESIVTPVAKYLSSLPGHYLLINQHSVSRVRDRSVVVRSRNVFAKREN